MIDELNGVAALKAELDELRPLDAEAEKRIMQKFRLDWNYHSNHLEGTRLTYGETRALILFGITAQGKPLKDHLEITGHNEAIDFVTEVVKDEYPLTEAFIRQLHTLLLKESYLVDAVTAKGQPTKRRVEIGKYKTQPNHVLTQTGETFYFASPEETPARMMDLIEWYRQKKAEDDVNPVVFAAEFHYKFIRIHPFDDGNGRLARILMNFILMQFGYPPVIIRTEDKNKYFSVLQQADAGVLEPFIEYIAANLRHSLEIMIRGAKGEGIEEPDDLDKELALLEQKVRNSGRKIEVPRSKEVIMEVFEKSIQPLISEFINTCEKFDKFYFQTDFTIYFGGSGISTSKETAIIDTKKKIEETDWGASEIHPVYRYSDFNQEGFDFARYDSDLFIKFENTKYTISSEINFSRQKNVNSITYEKLYSEYLTVREIMAITQLKGKEHLEFINEVYEARNSSA